MRLPAERAGAGFLPPRRLPKGHPEGVRLVWLRPSEARKQSRGRGRCRRLHWGLQLMEGRTCVKRKWVERSEVPSMMGGVPLAL